MDPTLLKAVYKVVLAGAAGYRKEAMVDRPERARAHDSKRRAEARKEGKRKLEKKVGEAVRYHSVVRACTMAQLTALLEGKSDTAQVAVLLSQTSHRLKGCGLGDAYSFGVELFSNGYSTAEKRTALHEQLKKMIKEERRAAAAKSKTLCFPDEPFLPAELANFKPPQLGTATVKREEHAAAAETELRSMVLTDDDPALLSVADKYPVGTLFYDGDDGTGSSRIILGHEWNPEDMVWEATTERVNDDGSELGPRKQKRREPYGLCDEGGDGSAWFPVFDGMVRDFQIRLKRKAPAAAAGPKKRTRR